MTRPKQPQTCSHLIYAALELVLKRLIDYSVVMTLFDSLTHYSIIHYHCVKL